MNGQPGRKWGQGQILAANKRRRTATDAARECDGEFDNVDEENPFDSIDRLLDLREAEQHQQHDGVIAEEDKNEVTEHIQHTEPIFSQHSEPMFSQQSQFFGEKDDSPTKPSISTDNTSNKHVNNEPPNEHFFGPSAEQKEKLQQTAASKKKQYSIIKSSTPRFTFQTTVKKSTLQTPATHRQALPNRTLFSTQTTQKSTKLTKRHSFRKSLEKPPVVKDVRSLECTPSFLPRGKRKEDTSPSETILPSETPQSSFASLKSSLIHETKPHSSRNGKAGYLIQRLRSLRNNDQRMAMRLRSGQLSKTKRRRSGNEFDAKHVAKSELDATVSCISSVFGEGRSMVVAYIHRFEGVNGGDSVGGQLEIPCFAWMLLSNDVMREQGLFDGAVKQLRFYDAVVIPRRLPGALQPSHALQMEMPTVACSTVCEQYNTAADTLPSVSFDRFIKSAY